MDIRRASPTLLKKGGNTDHAYDVRGRVNQGHKEVNKKARGLRVGFLDGSPIQKPAITNNLGTNSLIYAPLFQTKLLSSPPSPLGAKSPPRCTIIMYNAGTVSPMCNPGGSSNCPS